MAASSMVDGYYTTSRRSSNRLSCYLTPFRLTFAAVVAIESYPTKWWLPTVIFPGWIFVSRAAPLAPDQMTIGRVYAMRWYFYILATAYMIAQAVVFQMHVGSWYGWLIGLLIGWAVGGMVAGKLEPKLLHRGLP